MKNVPKEKAAGSPREKLTSDKMKNTAMVRLILQMSVPAMLSMLVLSLYNIVDSVFISRYDAKALDALSIAFPMQQFMIAFSVGVAIGTNAYVARKLGQKKYKEATLTAQTGLFLSMCCSLMFVVIALTLSRPFVSAFSSDPATIEYGVTYLTIVMSLSMASFVDVLCARVLQATGNMLVPMITQIVGAVVNIILDPVFIFVANMGVAGAAIATVAGQGVSMTISVLVFRFRKHDVNIFFDRNFRLKAKIIKGILKISLPTIVMNSVSAFVTVVLNAILKAYQSAITVLGVYFKLQSFVFMPIFGLNQGALPVMSYNYGAKDKKRFLEAVKWCFIFALSMMVIGLVLFQLLPDQLLRLFNAEGELLRVGRLALRVISVCFPFAAVGIIGATAMQALRYGTTSMIVSLMRQVILLIPFALLLSHFFGVDGVWAAYPASEAGAAILTAILLPILLKKCFAPKDLLPNLSEKEPKKEENPGDIGGTTVDA